MLAGFGCAAAAPAWAEDTTFAAGQVWTLKPLWALKPPMGAEARIRIGRIEDKGTTVHISFWVPVIPPEDADRIVVSSLLLVRHLAITADALRASVDKRVDEVPTDQFGFDDGYNLWRENHGNTFTLTVPQVIEAMLESTRDGKLRPSD